MQRIRGVTAFLILFTIFCVSSVEGRNKTMFSLGQVKKVADQEAGRLGYDIQNMDVQMDKENSQWKKYSTIIPHPDLEPKLKGRDFIAVYYSSKTQTLGGDLWVFVDRKIGKVITVLRGK